MHKPIIRRAAQCAVVALVVCLFAGAGDPASRFNEIGHRLVCVCGGCSDILLECNHVGCGYSDAMRNQLTAAIARGDSDSLVEQSFVQKYGPTVLAAPTGAGFDRAAWAFPFLAFGFGITGVVLLVRAWRNRPAPAVAGVRAIPNDELDKFREQAREETDL